MPDHQASIAASLRLIAGLLYFIAGAVIAYVVLQEIDPALLPFFSAGLIFAYFYGHWRTAVANVDREEQRLARLHAQWAEEDRIAQRLQAEAEECREERAKALQREVEAYEREGRDWMAEKRADLLAKLTFIDPAARAQPFPPGQPQAGPD